MMQLFPLAAGRPIAACLEALEDVVPGHLAAFGKDLPEADLRARLHDLIHVVALRESQLLEGGLERGRAGATKTGADYL